MITRVGVELGADTIRAVRLSGWPRSTIRALEVSWDPENPTAGLTALGEALGTVHRLTVAASLELLHVRRLRLPPLPAAEKRRILGLEPDRFFAVQGNDLVFWVRDNSDLVFAVREPLLSSWVPLLESIGRLEGVEPAPVALARAVSKAHIRDGCIIQNGADTGSVLTVLRDGRVHAVRRLFGNGLTAIEPAVESEGATTFYLYPWSEARAAAIRHVVPPDQPRALPDIAGLDPAFLTAYGAAISSPDQAGGGLCTPALEHKITRRRRRDRLLAAVGCVIALALLLWSVDAYRGRAERNLDRRIAALREQAGHVMALQSETEAILRETDAVAQVEASRPQPLEVFLAMSRLLPPTAYVRTVRATGAEWQIDGYAKDAAALIPLFENHPMFSEARFLSSTSRLRVGAETYESFSLACRTAPAP